MGGQDLRDAFGRFAERAAQDHRRAGAPRHDHRRHPHGAPGLVVTLDPGEVGAEKHLVLAGAGLDPLAFGPGLQGHGAPAGEPDGQRCAAQQHQPQAQQRVQAPTRLGHERGHGGDDEQGHALRQPVGPGGTLAQPLEVLRRRLRAVLDGVAGS